MAFLDDKQWEEMDWLNKAIEPFTFSLNGILANLPLEYVLNYNDLKNHIVHNEHVRIEYFLNHMLSEIKASKEECELLQIIGYTNFYKIIIAPNTIIDIDEQKIIGHIAIVKYKESLSDDDIKELLPTLNSFHDLRLSRMTAKNTYVNELLDLLECKEARRSTSVNKKASVLQNHITKMLHENTWNIKNVDLVIKLLKWIKSYVKNGDAYSLANISKLKCMTHKKNPIYSMEEVV